MTEEYQNGINVLDFLSEVEIERLPRWIKENLQSVRFINEDKSTIELPDGRRFSLNNSINDLAGSEWTRYICSVINTHYSTKGSDSFAHNIRKIHPTPKPPQLMKELIEFFTKENEIVLDYFMGVGGSLIGASLCGRRGAGIDLNEQYVRAYIQATEALQLPVQPCLCGNSSAILGSKEEMFQLLGNEQAGMILIDPPYANMMAKPKTGADVEIYGKKATPFTNSELDLGNLSKEEFIPVLKTIVEKSLQYLKKKGYLVIFCKDLQPKKKDTNMLHAEIVNAINEIPLLYYRGMKIWADQTVKLFPYGYPFDFVANQIHQYILIFRKY